MSGRFGFALKSAILGALVAGSMLGATAGTASAHDDRGWDRRGDRGWQERQWDRRGDPRGDWGRRDWRPPPPHHRHWREREVIYAPPPPVIYAPAPPPRVIYAPPPVVYAPPVAPGFGFSVNIR